MKKHRFMTKVNTGEKIHKPKKGKGSYNRNDISFLERTHLKWPLNSECVGRAGFNFED